jgi:hypothetical protein
VTFVKGTRIRRRNWVVKPRERTPEEIEHFQFLQRLDFLREERDRKRDRGRGRPLDQWFLHDFWRSIEFDDPSSPRALTENGEPRSFLRVARHMQKMNRPRYDAHDERSLERKARRYLKEYWKRIDDHQASDDDQSTELQKMEKELVERMKKSADEMEKQSIERKKKIADDCERQKRDRNTPVIVPIKSGT